MAMDARTPPLPPTRGGSKPEPPDAKAPTAAPPGVEIVNEGLLATAQALALPQTLRLLGAPPRPPQQMNNPRNLPVDLQGQRLYVTPYGDLAILQPGVQVVPSAAPLQQVGPGVGRNRGFELFQQSPPQTGTAGTYAEIELERMRAPLAIGASLDAQLAAMQAEQQARSGPAAAGANTPPRQRQ